MFREKQRSNAPLDGGVSHEVEKLDLANGLPDNIRELKTYVDTQVMMRLGARAPAVRRVLNVANGKCLLYGDVPLVLQRYAVRMQDVIAGLVEDDEPPPVDEDPQQQHLHLLSALANATAEVRKFAKEVHKAAKHDGRATGLLTLLDLKQYDPGRDTASVLATIVGILDPPDTAVSGDRSHLGKPNQEYSPRFDDTPTDDKSVRRALAKRLGFKSYALLVTHYRSLLGSVLYIARHTRHDCLYACNYLARLQTSPSAKAVKAALHLVSYLYNTRKKKRFIGFPCRKHQQTPLCLYSDSNFATRDPFGRSSTGISVVVFGNPFHFTSSRQTCAASSTTESEILALNSACRCALFMRTLINESLQFLQQKPVAEVDIYVDNNSLLPISSGRLTKRTRHMHVKGCWLYFVIRTLQIVQLKRVASKDNWSDAGTKPLRDQYFRFNRDIILGSARHFDWETFQSAGADSHDGDQQKESDPNVARRVDTPHQHYSA